MRSSPLVIAALAAVVAAKTDIGGCVSSRTTDPYGAASLLWYVPGSCEICELLDCGGGRAPPKTTVPGCAAYSGTETYTPSYLTNCGGGAQSATSATNVVVPTGPGPVVISTSSSSGSSSVTNAVPSATVTASPITTVNNGTTATITPGPGPVVISTSIHSNGSSTSTGSGSQSTGSSGPSNAQSGAGALLAQGSLAAVAAIAGAALML